MARLRMPPRRVPGQCELELVGFSLVGDGLWNGLGSVKWQRGFTGVKLSWQVRRDHRQDLVGGERTGGCDHHIAAKIVAISEVDQLGAVDLCDRFKRAGDRVAQWMPAPERR